MDMGGGGVQAMRGWRGSVRGCDDAIPVLPKCARTGVAPMAHRSALPSDTAAAVGGTPAVAPQQRRQRIKN
jgi:hypothetical protein